MSNSHPPAEKIAVLSGSLPASLASSPPQSSMSLKRVLKTKQGFRVFCLRNSMHSTGPSVPSHVLLISLRVLRRRTDGRLMFERRIDISNLCEPIFYDLSLFHMGFHSHAAWLVVSGPRSLRLASGFMMIIFLLFINGRRTKDLPLCVCSLCCCSMCGYFFCICVSLSL